jgi:hypothetical protein
MVSLALWETSLQQHIPPASLSRVSSYDWFGSLVSQPIAYAMTGAIAGAIGVGATLVGAGTLSIAAVLAMVSVPSVRRLTPPDTLVAQMGEPVSSRESVARPSSGS